MARVAAVLAATLTLLTAARALAKEHGVHTPTGRRIYDTEETFEQAWSEQSDRWIVIEVATGLAPEGQLAANLGFLLGPVEVYGGLGIQLDPARQLAFSARYWFDFGGFKPFLSLGYVNQNHTALVMTTHHAFSEVGYKWRWAKTYHFTLGVGGRYILATTIRDGSPLGGSDVDQDMLDETIDDVFPFMPTLSLRFSRAF